MKQKDIALLIVIAAVSAVLSFVVSGQIFVTPDNREQKVEVVDPITTSFTPPSDKYFNSESINPTQLVVIGENDNQNPFDGSAQ